MSETIFSKIIAGEIPAHKIYEDERVLAFLDIYPKHEGHTLVIPKKAVEFVWDLDEESYLYLMRVTQKIAQHLRRQLPYRYVSLKIVGTDVPHAHIHLIPFNLEDTEPQNPVRADDAELADLAERLKLSQP